MPNQTRRWGLAELDEPNVPFWETEHLEGGSCRNPHRGILGTSEENADIYGVMLAFQKVALQASEEARITLLERMLTETTKRIAKLEQNTSVIVTIDSLAPLPYRLQRPLQITVKPSEEEFIAAYFDANISVTGDTEIEAIDNLKDSIVQNFEVFQELADAPLGATLKRHVDVLKSVVSKID